MISDDLVVVVRYLAVAAQRRRLRTGVELANCLRQAEFFDPVPCLIPRPSKAPVAYPTVVRQTALFGTKMLR